MAKWPVYRHMEFMTQIDTPSETIFRIFLQDDQSYAIEVTIPDSFPTIIRKFDTEAASQAWIENYRARLLVKATRKSWGRR